MKKQKVPQKLINAVLAQISEDFDYGDLTAIEELLRFCPISNLVWFLKDDKIDQFKKYLPTK